MGKARPRKAGITVRRGKTSDRPQLLRWMRQLAEEMGDGKKIGEDEAEGIGPEGLFMAHVGGKPAGFIQLAPEPETFRHRKGSVTGHAIELGYTDPAHRERGVFTALDARLERHAREHPDVERLISQATHPHVAKVRREGGWTELEAPEFRKDPKTGKTVCVRPGLFVKEVK